MTSSRLGTATGICPLGSESYFSNVILAECDDVHDACGDSTTAEFNLFISC